jgi:hypothetical protein
MLLRRVWLDAAVTEPVPCDPIFPSQPGSVDTVKILVSAGLGFRERTSCTELESRSAGPPDDGKPINHLLSLVMLQVRRQPNNMPLHNISLATEGLAHWFGAG